MTLLTKRNSWLKMKFKDLPPTFLSLEMTENFSILNIEIKKSLFKEGNVKQKALLRVIKAQWRRLKLRERLLKIYLQTQWTLREINFTPLFIPQKFQMAELSCKQLLKEPDKERVKFNLKRSELPRQLVGTVNQGLHKRLLSLTFQTNRPPLTIRITKIRAKWLTLLPLSLIV